MKLLKSNFLSFCAVYALVSIAVVLGMLQFEPWEQVSLLWEKDVNPLFFIGTGHPHVPRYLVAYPGFLLEDLFPSVGFSLYISIFLAMNVQLFRSIALIMIRRAPILLINAAFVSVLLVMNGRGVIAWAAWLLCVLICLKMLVKTISPIRQFFYTALSCWLASVSTGVFTLVVFILFIFMLKNTFGGHKSGLRRSLIWSLLLVVFAYFVSDHLIVSISKNLVFYGGGLTGAFNMLEHGVGTIFVKFTLFNVILIFCACCSAVVFSYAALFGHHWTALEWLILFCFVGGMFGITVLTLVIPLLLLKLNNNFLRFFVPSSIAPIFQKPWRPQIYYR
jgi:hypothetical protein